MSCFPTFLQALKADDDRDTEFEVSSAEVDFGANNQAEGESKKGSETGVSNVNASLAFTKPVSPYPPHKTEVIMFPATRDEPFVFGAQGSSE
jgi:hypothetical protein